MPLTHLAASASSQDAVTLLRSDGACIIDGLASAELVDRVAAEMEPHLMRTLARPTEQHTRRTGALIARSAAGRELVMNELVLGAVGALLEKASTYQVHVTQVISVLPGEQDQRFHRDEEAWDRYPFPTDYDIECSVMWALTDFSVENGATRVLPGTHRLAPDATVAEAVAAGVEERAVMGKGSALLFTGKVFHGAGANRTESPRRGLVISYSVGWVRQEENQYLATPRAVARTLDRKLLELMGYQKGGPTLGYIGDVQEPITAVLGESVAGSATA